MTPLTPDGPRALAARERAQAAARLLATKGPAAYLELEGPPHSQGEDYVFAFEFSGTLVAHGVAKYRGIDVRTLRDVQGKAFGQEFLAVAQSAAGEGWVEYWWPRPGGDAPERKLSFIKRVPGQAVGVGTGVYAPAGAAAQT